MKYKKLFYCIVALVFISGFSAFVLTVVAVPNPQYFTLAGLEHLGRQSRDIVLDGEVKVTRGDVSFSVRNHSDTTYFSSGMWQLMRWVDGRWESVSRIEREAIEHPDSGFFVFIEATHSVPHLGNQSLRQHFFFCYYGELPNGRYLLTRVYSTHRRPVTDGRSEFVGIVFVLDDNTPPFAPPGNRLYILDVVLD